MQIDYIEVLINIVLASFGGLVRRLVTSETSGKKPSLSFFAVGSLISMFVGIVAYILCKSFGATQLLTAGLTALAGYMGSPLLDLLSDIAKKRIEKANGS